ncbi:MAG: SMC-Scp complex subunit ScpB [Alphaproteobacteria bacterium]|nr:SMC-Scp complex subunit ScpB [Alphaproteobacteria bacterium]MBU1560091.1 SMC-Scp complex subunit ScpB [Alphaproteobacteria bacterium]MBU2303253.1 SMC-Scp complex subunit ScpB [Alphaproteobacteria bacterium]MBU2366140.1 SMC-Scp complex subunit ScpB [Alphaproteobacteria bacterium]
MARRKRADAEPAIFDTELADMPADLRRREWMNRIEAVLFAAPKPVEREALARVIGRDASIDLLIDDIREALRGKPYDVVGVAGGWAFRTRTAYADAIAASAAVPDRLVDLTQNEAMVLVSIAYHQPVTRAGVSEILGREVSRDVIGALRDKNMITAGPRSPTAGAPFTYVTTKGFLEHFGLDTLRDLPDVQSLDDAGLLGGNTTEIGRQQISGLPNHLGSVEAVEDYER